MPEVEEGLPTSLAARSDRARMRPMPAERVILHADMDAFYASIEQRDHPELRGQPVIVGAVSPRGVVAAASYEARRFGVHSAMPGFEARRRCPQGVFLPSDMRKYARVSEQVHDVFAEFTPQIEPLALDEAFLDVSGSVRLFGGAVPLARRLKRRVNDETGLTISVGLAPNKLVAKIACSLSKPDGLLWCPPEQVASLLASLPVGRLWGVGPVLAQQLERAGFRTLGELGSANRQALSAVVGDRAESLAALARGEDSRPVDGGGDPKSYGEENTFEQDVTDRDKIVSTLLWHAQAIAKRLRRDRFRGRTVTLKVKLGQRRPGGGSSRGTLYPLLTRRRTLDRATADGQKIGAVAIALWDAAGVTQPLRLLGVSVSSLEHGAAQQLALFEPQGADRRERLGHVVDAIQAKFGEQAIGPALQAATKLTPSDRKKRGT